MRTVQRCIEFFREPRSVKSALIIGILALSLDFVTKLMVVMNMSYGQKIPLIPCFNIVRVHNYGFSFGILNSFMSPIIMALLCLVIVVFLLMWARREKIYLFPAIIISLGAVGNIIDRFAYGYVVDFLDFYIKSYHWPAFNVADCAIVFGNINLLLILMCENNRDTYKEVE